LLVINYNYTNDARTHKRHISIYLLVTYKLQIFELNLLALIRAIFRAAKGYVVRKSVLSEKGIRLDLLFMLGVVCIVLL